MTTKKDNNLTKEKLLAEIERLMKDLESERLNEMLKQDFRISKLSMTRH